VISHDGAERHRFQTRPVGLKGPNGQAGHSMDQTYYAHSLEGKPPSDWQPLEKHPSNVVKGAEEFASAFQSVGHGMSDGCMIHSEIEYEH
jgi:hypothetical protein